MRHDVTFPLCVEVEQIYNLACPASRIHYQYDPVQINHYTNKSYDKYVNRKMRNGRADHVLRVGEVPVPLESFHRVDHRSTERDYSIQRFLTQLKLRLLKK